MANAQLSREVETRNEAEIVGPSDILQHASNALYTALNEGDIDGIASINTALRLLSKYNFYIRYPNEAPNRNEWTLGSEEAEAVAKQYMECLETANNAIIKITNDITESSALGDITSGEQDPLSQVRAVMGPFLGFYDYDFDKAPKPSDIFLPAAQHLLNKDVGNLPRYVEEWFGGFYFDYLMKENPKVAASLLETAASLTGAYIAQAGRMYMMGNVAAAESIINASAETTRKIKQRMDEVAESEAKRGRYESAANLAEEATVFFIRRLIHTESMRSTLVKLQGTSTHAEDSGSYRSGEVKIAISESCEEFFAMVAKYPEMIKHISPTLIPLFVSAAATSPLELMGTAGNVFIISLSGVEDGKGLTNTITLIDSIAATAGKMLGSVRGDTAQEGQIIRYGLTRSLEAYKNVVLISPTLQLMEEEHKTNIQDAVCRVLDILEGVKSNDHQAVEQMLEAATELAEAIEFVYQDDNMSHIANRLKGIANKS